MDVATWNVLHDGRVIAAEGSVPGDLRLSVEIAYLCHHLPTKAEHLVVTLVGCERFEYQPYEQAPQAEPSAIAALGLELLTAGAGLDDGCINIECGGRRVRWPTVSEVRSRAPAHHGRATAVAV